MLIFGPDRQSFVFSRVYEVLFSYYYYGCSAVRTVQLLVWLFRRAHYSDIIMVVQRVYMLGAIQL